MALTLGLTVALGPSEAIADWTPPPPTLPDPPEGATCVYIQRGTLGDIQDADVSLGNGTWAAGAHPYTWTGPSPYDHWSLYNFDLSAVPAESQVVLAVFSTYVSWNEAHAEVRLHRITAPWEELTVTWQNFGGTASWDPSVIASFDGHGYGYKSSDITALVQGWRAGLFPQHGLLMEEDPVALHSYFAGESSTAGIRPSLYVCYVQGGPCAGKVDGDACDDGNLCTLGETCQSGQCAGGAPPTCAAIDDCHEAGVCDPSTGLCSTPEKQDGAPCDDADLCTESDVCMAGQCVGGAPVTCFDGSACTTDVCDPQVGCVNTTVSCDDGDACTADGCDAGAGCTHEPITCDDGDACTADVCDPATGCGTAPLSCDDGNACTVDTCDAVSGCSHSALSCNDGEVCTADTCDPVLGCVSTPVACDDALACTADACAPGVGCEHVVACPPGAPCAVSFCSSPAGQTEAYAWFCN
ncbi:MAG: DNRLRE domain-containing protein [Polyangiaceae bacterium]